MARMHRILLWTVLAVVVLGAVGIVIYQVRDHKNPEAPTEDKNLPPIRLVLNNGGGFEGAAGEFANWLADKNVEIIATGNTLRPVYNKTIIINRKGRREDLQRLIRMTGIQRWTEIKTESALADFEIIVGKDYEQYTKH